MTPVGQAESQARRAILRVQGGFGLILQGTAAATLAWFIARQLVGNHEPFFAPIAAVVALNASVGRRGINTLRLLTGVFIGIGVGELSLQLLGRNPWTLPLAVLVALTLARAVGAVPIVIGQAAASAILTVAVSRGQPGVDRLFDALIGSGVALVFTQVVFSPEPLRLLRRAEAAALNEMSAGLTLTAQSLEQHDQELVERALSRLRTLRDRLAELHQTRDASTASARHSLIWRWRRLPTVVVERESAGHLDLLGGACVMVIRFAMATEPGERSLLAPRVGELAAALEALAQGPGDWKRRQLAAANANAIAQRLEHLDLPQGTALSGAVVAMRMVAADLTRFARVEAQAEDPTVTHPGRDQ